MDGTHLKYVKKIEILHSMAIGAINTASYNEHAHEYVLGFLPFMANYMRYTSLRAVYRHISKALSINCHGYNIRNVVNAYSTDK